MNSNIERIALDVGLLNYVDNETPRRYFINGNADLDEVQDFAVQIVVEVIRLLTEGDQLKSTLTAAAILTEFFTDQLEN